ncbi:MAG: hypothetical protein ACKOYJ_09130 [Planctomycetia bacterium]
METIPLVLLALVTLVALAGVIAFGVGHKGWNWGTVAAAILLLLSAAGFVYLVARVGERERIWRTKVRDLEASIAKERDAARLTETGELEPIPNEPSIADLEDQRNRWSRALERVETWHGRFWPKGAFRPPQGNQPGQIRFAMPAGAAPNANPFINPGAQLFLFDDEPADNGGRFLGIFRVREAATDQGALVLSLDPAAPPGAGQAARWRQEYDNVRAFESLPVDRWLAFYRMPRKGDAADEDSSAMPRPKKDESQAKALLEELEKQFADFEHHARSEPKDEWESLSQDGAPSQGSYWAAVTFKAAHAMTTREAGRDPKTIQFEKGDTADIELSAARGLADEGVVEIRDVVYRRPLADAETALQGAMVPVSGESTFNVRGAFTIRSVLEDEIARAKQAINDLQAATKHMQNSTVMLEKEKDELREDRTRWGRDVTGADSVVGGIKKRLDRTSLALDEAWKAVIELGREYDGTMALLQADAAKRADGQR